MYRSIELVEFPKFQTIILILNGKCPGTTKLNFWEYLLVNANHALSNPGLTDCIESVTWHWGFFVA